MATQKIAMKINLRQNKIESSSAYGKCPGFISN